MGSVVKKYESVLLRVNGKEIEAWSAMKLCYAMGIQRNILSMLITKYGFPKPTLAVKNLKYYTAEQCSIIMQECLRFGIGKASGFSHLRVKKVPRPTVAFVDSVRKRWPSVFD